MDYRISVICLEKIFNNSVWDGYHTKNTLETVVITFNDIEDANAYGANLAVKFEDEKREANPEAVFFIYYEVKKV